MTRYVDGAWERFTALAGGTAYREPLQGGGSSQGGMPGVHEISAAIAMARQGDDDLGPDVLFDLVTQSFRHRERVVTRLTDAVCSRMGLNRHEVVVEAMTDSYFRVVLGDDQAKTAINGALATLSDVGVAVLTERAGITARRAHRCLKD